MGDTTGEIAHSGIVSNRSIVASNSLDVMRKKNVVMDGFKVAVV